MISAEPAKFYRVCSFLLASIHFKACHLPSRLILTNNRSLNTDMLMQPHTRILHFYGHDRSCQVVVQSTSTTMLHIPTGILHIEIHSVQSNNPTKLFSRSLHHARFRLSLLCLSFHLFNNPFAVSPRPFLPNLAVVSLLNPSQLPQTIVQG